MPPSGKSLVNVISRRFFIFLIVSSKEQKYLHSVQSNPPFYHSYFSYLWNLCLAHKGLQQFYPEIFLKKPYKLAYFRPVLHFVLSFVYYMWTVNCLSTMYQKYYLNNFVKTKKQPYTWESTPRFSQFHWFICLHLTNNIFSITVYSFTGKLEIKSCNSSNSLHFLEFPTFLFFYVVFIKSSAN